MNKIIPILLCLCIFIVPVKAQKVGLVLSGGGAKGITHIGIIRALEENNIPIDYVAGTSMGAIVGALYAMGYSPDDMERLIKSDDFKRWYTGNIEEQYICQGFFKESFAKGKGTVLAFECSRPVADELCLFAVVRASHGFLP